MCESYSVSCKNCFALGPLGSTKEEAANLWNDRGTPKMERGLHLGDFSREMLNVLQKVNERSDDPEIRGLLERIDSWEKNKEELKDNRTVFIHDVCEMIRPVVDGNPGEGDFDDSLETMKDFLKNYGGKNDRI